MDWSYFDKFEGIINKYMPTYGEGDTMASQAVTAVNKLVYKWYNDGDVFDTTYNLKGWVNDLSSYANWLAKYAQGAEDILNGIATLESDEEYEELLAKLADLILTEDYLEKLPTEKQGSIYDCEGAYRYQQSLKRL